jgi:hypothetical protein
MKSAPTAPWSTKHGSHSLQRLSIGVTPHRVAPLRNKIRSHSEHCVEKLYDAGRTRTPTMKSNMCRCSRLARFRHRNQAKVSRETRESHSFVSSPPPTPRHRGSVFGECLSVGGVRQLLSVCVLARAWPMMTCPVASAIPHPGFPTSRIWKSVRRERDLRLSGATPDLPVPFNGTKTT